VERGFRLFLFLLLLFACVLWWFLPRPARVTRDREGKRTRIVVSVLAGGLERDLQLWRALEAEFERTAPAIDIKMIRGGAERKLDTMIAGGVAPDVIALEPSLFGRYVRSGVLADLTSFLETAPELARDLEEGGDFFRFAADAFRHKGRMWALPAWYVNFFVFYNKDLFDKYGVPYPDSNWDWEGFRRRALALTRDRFGNPVRIPKRNEKGEVERDERGFTVYVPNPRSDGKAVEFGLYYAWWQHGVESFIRQNDGVVIAEAGTAKERVCFSDPRTVEALHFLYDLNWKDGVTPTATRTPGVSPLAKFKTGKLAMYGPFGVFALIDFRQEIKDFAWDVAPPPRGLSGVRASAVIPTGFAITARSRVKEAAFRFLRFLSGRRGLAIAARWPVFIPARRSIALSEKYFLKPGGYPAHPRFMVDDVTARWRDPRTGKERTGYAFIPASASERYEDVYDVINSHLLDLLFYNRWTPREAAARIDREAARVMAWTRAYEGGKGRDARLVLFLVPACALALALAGVGFCLFKFRRLPAPERREALYGYLFISPWLLGFLLLTAGPILFSFALSFCRWSSLGSLREARFIGLDNYLIALRGEDPKFYAAFTATLRYALASVPLGLFFGLGLSLLMNARLRGIRFWRTVYFLPSVVPAVAVAVLCGYLFSPERGWINYVLRGLGFRETPDWFGSTALFLGIPVAMWVFILMSLWTVGGTMIIYLGSLQGIPTELYEAARIDGAGRVRSFFHVTLPLISPILLFNLIMGIIGSFQVFTQAYVLNDGEGGVGDVNLFYVLHLFREAIRRYRFGYGCALAWLLFLVILFLTLSVFRTSRFWVYSEGSRDERTR